jgi:hypothetical protein
MKRSQVAILLFSILLVAGCTDSPIIETPEVQKTSYIATAPPSPSKTPLLTAVETPAITQEQPTQPDSNHHPPDYQLEDHDFSIEVFDLPEGLIGKEGVFYDKKANYQYSLYFLASNGSKRIIFNITIPAELRDYSRWIELAEDNQTLVLQLKPRKGKDHPERFHFYIFDIYDGSHFGFSIPNKVATFDPDWLITERDFILGYVQYYDQEFAQCNDDQDWEYFIYFIDRDDPRSVRLEKYSDPGTGFWETYNELGEHRYHAYCTLTNKGERVCKDLQEYSWYISNTFRHDENISPDGKWLEVRGDYQGGIYRSITILPVECIIKEADECYPPVWIPIQNVKDNWASECAEVNWRAIWSEDSRSMYFLIEQHAGVAGWNPDRYCLGPWSGPEIWRFDLYDESLDLIRKYQADEFVLSENNDGSFTYLSILQPPVMSENGEIYFASVKDWDWKDEGHDLFIVYLISLSDGEYRLVGETATHPIAVVNLGRESVKPEESMNRAKRFPDFVCGDQKMKTDLELDKLAVVNPVYKDPNMVRENSNTKYRVVGKIQPGSQVKILYGPRCEEGIIWWYVQTLDSDIFGWTAEGDGEQNWLIPIEE